MCKSGRKVYATAYEFQQLYDMPIKKLRIGIIHEEKKFFVSQGSDRNRNIFKCTNSTALY